MRMRRKSNLAPRMEKCAHLLVTEPDKLKGRWLEAFQACDELHVELGCGKGRFTSETAKAEPGVFVAALEKSASAMLAAVERADGEGLKNVRFMNAFADDLTDFFAPGEVSRIYINFCDPWPANRHAKRRLTSGRFLELYKRVLRPGGEIHFKTDNLPLFEFSLNEFLRAGFELSEATRDLHADGPVGVMTDYELKFHSQGISIKRMVAINP